MTKDEIEQLKSCLQEIVEYDTVEAATEQWPEADFDTTALGVFTVTTFLANLERVVEQFLVPLENDGIFFLSTFNEPETFNGPVVQAARNLVGQLKGNNWSAAATFLLYLIRYQMRMGIWDRSEARVHAGNDLKALEELKSLQAQSARQKNEIEILKSEHQKLGELVTAKKKELNQIENLRDSARTNREEIQTILQDATKKQESLENIVTSQNKHKASIEEKLKELDQKDKTLAERITEIDGLHKSASTLQNEMQSKRDEIDKLLMDAADGRLSHTFKKRSTQLEARVRSWVFIIFLSFAIGVSWFALSSTLIEIPTTNPWVVFLLLTLKLTPALVLIFWTLKQYGRERSFLEEYSFKSSVALTLHSYADELASENYALTSDDFDDPKEYQKYLSERDAERKKLIKDTVEKLYNDPGIHRDNSSRWISLRPKAAKEVISEVRNLVRESKGSI
jgi:hypothetical protein